MSLTVTMQKTSLVFKNYIEIKSCNCLIIEIYSASRLGMEAEIIEWMKTGTQNGSNNGLFVVQKPRLNLIMMPFFFESRHDLTKVTHSEIGKMIKKDLEKYLI